MRGTTDGVLWLLLIALLVSAVFVLQACSGAPPVTQAAAATSAGTTTAAPAPIKATADEDGYVASGPLIVENQVDVTALRSGVISEILVDVGQAVHQGQLLARLDDRQATAERDAAESKLKSCEANVNDWEAETKLALADYDRAQRMRDAGINTQEELEHARYKWEGSKFEIEKAQRELDTARDALRVAELELQKTRIEAPFDGVVARRYVRAGQTAAPGERMFWVSALSPLLVKFTLPERFLGRIKTGDLVDVSSTSGPDESHSAKVVQMSPVVDPASDSIDLMAKVEGKPGSLRPGMTVNIRMAAAAVPPQ